MLFSLDGVGCDWWGELKHRYKTSKTHRPVAETDGVGCDWWGELKHRYKTSKTHRSLTEKDIV